MFNRCVPRQQDAGLSYTGLQAAINLIDLRNRLTVFDCSDTEECPCEVCDPIIDPDQIKDNDSRLD